MHFFEKPRWVYPWIRKRNVELYAQLPSTLKNINSEKLKILTSLQQWCEKKHLTSLQGYMKKNFKTPIGVHKKNFKTPIGVHEKKIYRSCWVNYPPPQEQFAPLPFFFSHDFFSKILFFVIFFDGDWGGAPDPPNPDITEISGIKVLPPCLFFSRMNFSKFLILSFFLLVTGEVTQTPKSRYNRNF